MTEPPRLFSTPESELERALLDAGRSYTASSSARSKTLLSLGVTAATTSIVPAAASGSLSKAALSKVAVTVLVLGAIAVPVWRYLDRGASTPVAQPSVAHPPAVAAATPAPPPAVEPAPSALATSETAPVDPVEAPARSNARSAGAARSEPKSAPPPLTAELAALDAARTSLGRSDAAAALVALDGYAHDFPRGRLKMEAEVLRIGALAKNGQTDAARKRAETFLRLHPDSVLASRVRTYAGL